MTLTFEKTIGYYLALMMLVVMPAIGAETRQWDNVEAQQLADKLVADAFKLRIEWRGHPSAEVGDRTQHLLAKYNVRRFQSEALQLCDALEEGKGQTDTQPIYSTLVEAKSQITAYMQAKDTPKWPPIDQALQNADATLAQLGEFYSK